MSIFESVKKVVKKTAKDVTKVSGDLVEQTKLKLKAFDLKDDINEQYKKIGELYYTAAEYEIDNSEKIASCVDAVKELKKQLAETEEEIKKCKNIKKCLNCGSDNTAEDSFCSKCGEKLE